MFDEVGPEDPASVEVIDRSEGDLGCQQSLG